MANTAAVYARIDPTLKKDVEVILNELQVSPSSLIQMLYAQIKLTKGIPFELKLPTKPVCVDEITPDQLENELKKGLQDVEKGKVHSQEVVKTKLKKDLKL